MVGEAAGPRADACAGAASTDAATASTPSGGSTLGGRRARVLSLLGLTGFAVSQPLLAVAGEDPSLFVAAEVSGWRIAAFALIVACVPPLLLWLVVELVGSFDRRAGDAAFVLLAAALVGTTAIQWTKTAVGVDARWALAGAGALGAVAFGLAFVRWPAVALWTRFTAVLPPAAVVLLLAASPAGDLLRSREAAPIANTTDAGDARASVVFVLLDEFPLQTILDADGAIDAARFPNLAEFAAGATWYRDFTALARRTSQSVPSILTGTDPTGGVATWRSQPDNLFRLLAPTHELEVIEPIIQLCGFTNCDVEGASHAKAGGVRSLLGQMVDVWSDRVSLDPIPEPDLGQFASAAEPLDPEAQDGDDRAAGEDRQPAPALLLDFLGALRTNAEDPPSLAYLHLLLPHQPWERYPDGRTFEGASVHELAARRVEVTDWDLALLEQALAYQASYTDRLVGQVLDTLRANGTYDDTLVVLTADHGIGFDLDQFPDVRRADPATIDQLAYVPLLVKSPGQQDGRVDDSNLTTSDLLPTIASELGIEVPWSIDGVAAGSPEIAARGDRKRLFLFDGPKESEPAGELDFTSAAHRPSAAGRRIEPVAAGSHSLAGLLRPVGGDRWLGARVEDLDLEPSSRGFVDEFDGERLRDGSADRQPGVVRGQARGLDVGDLVLLVVDGAVQSGAPVLPDRRVEFMVPSEVSAHPGLAVSLLRVDGDRLIEVETRP